MKPFNYEDDATIEMVLKQSDLKMKPDHEYNIEVDYSCLFIVHSKEGAKVQRMVCKAYAR